MVSRTADEKQLANIYANIFNKNYQSCKIADQEDKIKIYHTYFNTLLTSFSIVTVHSKYSITPTNS